MDTVTVVARYRPNRSHQVRVTLALRDWAESESFLVRAPGYVCAIGPLDNLALNYGAKNWETGVLTGAGYAWRRWQREGLRKGLLLIELSGTLGDNGIEGIAAATSAALAALLQTEPWQWEATDWETEILAGAANGQTAPSDMPAGAPRLQDS
jgi:hypothetical protein